MWCHNVCDVAESSYNFNNAHDNDSDDDDDDDDDEENDDISVSEKYLPLGWWGSSSFTPSPGLPGPFLIHKCFHGNRDLGSLIESLYHLGNRAKGGAWLIVFFFVVFFYGFIFFVLATHVRYIDKRHTCTVVHAMTAHLCYMHTQTYITFTTDGWQLKRMIWQARWNVGHL